jgi:hypothetical protein
MLQPPHMGQCLGSILLLSTHLCPHFMHTQSATFFHSFQTSISNLKHLIFSITIEPVYGLRLSSSTCLSCRFNLNFFRYERYLIAAFRTFAVVRLNYLVGGFQFYAFVENKTAFFTDYLLRQDLTAVAEPNTTDTNYLYIMTKQSSKYRTSFFHISEELFKSL